MQDYIKKLSSEDQKKLQKDIEKLKERGKRASAWNNALVEVDCMLFQDDYKFE